MEDDQVKQHNYEGGKGYWKSILGFDQKRWYSQELYMRDQLGLSIIDDDALEQLRTKKRRGKLISNIPNYDILSNYRYADDFMYTAMERRTENLASDLVSQIVHFNEQKD